MSRALLVALAAVAGAGLPVQAGINAQLVRWAGHAVSSALVSFVVGTVGLAVLAALIRVPWPAALSRAPWWAFSGGIIGAIFVAAAAYLAPRLGAAVFVGVVVAAQMGASLVLDHFGVLGFPKQPVTAVRLLGVLLVVCGVALIRRF
jgi:transporter family-2 protein